VTADRRRFFRVISTAGLGLGGLVGCSLPRNGAEAPRLDQPTAAATTVAAATAAPTSGATAASSAPPPVDARSTHMALEALLEGNARYVEQKLAHPNQTSVRLTEVAQGQAPFAAILGCADSRVPPEIVFDRGLGDLFVVRGAGNLADEVAIGSLEFAVAALKVPVIMVLGHERCGAVQAAVSGGIATGHIGALVRAIQPAVERTRGAEGDPVENAIVANVQIVVANLKNTGPILSEAVQNGTLRIVGGRYDLDSGKVELVAD
jgi:carbonic anhydrase